ncbi:hypothetical protein J1605_013462 [Eschrichtius robustus]|uniref:Uncharacterized protein n=1 Tax=Eschrichtius robustus TaxID=9764 RepID=A0AB34GJW7_ESCRO|nr:hypothetical protein J1605_013462 [Eschrichtius robustus]
MKSRLGFDDLHAERILNYSAELQEVDVLDSFSGLRFLSKRPQNLLVGPQDGSSLIELWLLGHGSLRCVWLFYKCSFPLTCRKGNYFEIGIKGKRSGNTMECPQSSVDMMYHSVQVFDQWQKGSLFQRVLVGTGHGLEALGTQSGEGSQPCTVVGALQAALLLLNDSVAVDGPQGSHTPTRILLHLQKLQRVLWELPPWLALTRLLQLDGALGSVVAQHLHLVRGKLAPGLFVPNSNHGNMGATGTQARSRRSGLEWLQSQEVAVCTLLLPTVEGGSEMSDGAAA